MPGVWKYDSARIVAVCDLDAKRVEDAKRLVNGYYAKGGPAVQRRHRLRGLPGAAEQQGYRRGRHQHARPLACAARRGGRAGRQGRVPAEARVADHCRGARAGDAVHRSGRIFQIGSQQRSSPQLRYAAELVRNGRIGRLQTVKIGLPGDPAGGDEPEMPVPPTLNYDMWLGSTPDVYYTEKRVHPQAGYGRPGWLRCEQFGAGMITGLGRAPPRLRALGDGHRIHRAGRDLGHGGVPEERALGRPRARSRPRRSTPAACT